MNQYKLLIVAPKESGKVNLSDHAQPHITDIQLWKPHIQSDAKKILRKILQYDDIKFIGNWQDDQICRIINEIATASMLVINAANQSLHAG